MSSLPPLDLHICRECKRTNCNPNFILNQSGGYGMIFFDMSKEEFANTDGGDFLCMKSGHKRSLFKRQLKASGILEKAIGQAHLAIGKLTDANFPQDDSNYKPVKILDKKTRKKTRKKTEVELAIDKVEKAKKELKEARWLEAAKKYKKRTGSYKKTKARESALFDAIEKGDTEFLESIKNTPIRIFCKQEKITYDQAARVKIAAKDKIIFNKIDVLRVSYKKSAPLREVFSNGPIEPKLLGINSPIYSDYNEFNESSSLCISCVRYDYCEEKILSDLSELSSFERGAILQKGCDCYDSHGEIIKVPASDHRQVYVEKNILDSLLDDKYEAYIRVQKSKSRTF